MGFHTPQKGKIILDGQDITELAPEKRGIGYVPQNTLLFPHMTVRQNILFGLKMHGKVKAIQGKVVDELLDLVRLKGMDDRLPAGLSGGEKQKVALARALAIDSELVLLDEPLASIDSVTARQLREELKRLHKESGRTIIHVTHSLIEGIGLADKIALIRAGAILQTGTVEEILAKPKNEFAAQLLGYENVFRAELLEKRSDFCMIIINGVRLRVSGSFENVKMAAIRPEDISIEFSHSSDDTANILKGEVSDYSDLGPLVMVKVVINAETAFPIKAFLAKNSFIEKGLENGKVVWLRLLPNAIKIIE
jgi:molybdate/tungstate transport system ATP-binding protein